MMKRKFVIKYIKDCIDKQNKQDKQTICYDCKFAKKLTSKQRGLLNLIDKGNRWHTWHREHLGPLCIC